MKPIKQTQFGKSKEDPHPGNCYAACIASILELPLGEIPNFCAKKGDWWTPAQQWFQQRGLVVITVDANADGMYDGPVLADGLYCVINGPGPRGCPHCIVGRYRLKAEKHWIEVPHDPHPSNDGLTGWTSFDFFGVMNPEAIHACTPKDKEG